MRGSIGTAGSLTKAGLGVRPSLVRAIAPTTGLPRPRRAPREFSGPKPTGRSGSVKHADNVVLEVRRLREQCGMTPTPIVAHLTGIGVEITLADVERYVKYESRALLIPAPDAEPYI